MMFVRLFSLLAVACICLCAQHGRFAITMKSAPNLKDHPVMMSAIGNGSIVSQKEIFLKEGETWATVDGIPPGMYDVTVSKTGFRVAKVAAQKVTVGLLRTIDVTMEVGSVAETVQVSASVGAELQTTTHVADETGII